MNPILEGYFAGSSSHMNHVELVSEKKILLTETKTDLHFPRYWQPLIEFCVREKSDKDLNL